MCQVSNPILTGNSTNSIIIFQRHASDSRWTSSIEPKAKLHIPLGFLTGHYRNEHLFSLKQALESYDFYQQQILACDQKIEQTLIDLNSEPIKPTSGDDQQPLSS